MTYEETKTQKAPIKKRIAPKEIQVHTVLEEQSVYLKPETPTARYLKVQPCYRQPKLASGPPQRIMPELRLCGHWLAEAGFDAGRYVTVTVMDGLLVIRRATLEDAAP
jgi:hypothetical protein